MCGRVGALAATNEIGSHTAKMLGARTTQAIVAASTMAVLGTSLGMGGGPASAVDIRPLDNGRTTAIILTHAETVAAAQIGAGNLINVLLGNDRWRIALADGSRYARGDYYRPDKARTWNNVTGQQVVSEAAAHPGGRVALGITPADPSFPLWVQQLW